MKIAKSLSITILSLLGLALPMTGESQVYTLSTPISGGMSLSMSDAGYSGSIGLTFNTLTETIYLDPVAQTIRQVGFVSVSPSAPNIVFNESRQVPGQFPNPPQQVSATVTVNLGLTGGGLSFDTGARPVTWNNTVQAYTVDSTIGNIPVSGSYSLLTGGQTYTGSFNYYLYNYLGWAGTYSQLSTIQYPNSISLSSMVISGGMFCEAVSSSDVADVTAANGLDMQLSPGSYMWGLVYAESFGWSSDPVTATLAVPEPSLFPILGLGLCGMIFLRRRQR
jgi:PEP-CTERM motif